MLRITQNGKDISTDRRNLSSKIDPYVVARIDLKHSLMGGKGGFGSLLRSMKPKVKGD